MIGYIALFLLVLIVWTALWVGEAYKFGRTEGYKECLKALDSSLRTLEEEVAFWKAIRTSSSDSPGSPPPDQSPPPGPR